MHWFDRMSKQFAAVPTETTRRGALRGAAVAAVVAPFAPGALAHADRYLKAQTNNETCLACLVNASRVSQNAIHKCNGVNPFVPQLQPKGGAKGGKGGAPKKGAKPSAAAKRAACMTKAAQNFLRETTYCVRVKCAGSPTTPTPTPGSGASGPEGSTCPSGTVRCSGTLCCYGGDNCCPCATVDGGNICCVAVIQCSCCSS